MASWTTAAWLACASVALVGRERCRPHTRALARLLPPRPCPPLGLPVARCGSPSRFARSPHRRPKYPTRAHAISPLRSYSDAFDGTLEPCGALIDAHVRLLADCLLTGSAARTTAGYSALASLPPMAARQHSAAGAAVGAAALLKLREDSELLVSLLATAEEGDKAKEAAEEVAAGRALVDAVDMVLGALPAPSE